MSRVVTFTDYRPPPRFDTVPWTAVRVEERAADTGDGVQIDLIAFADPDLDPRTPAERSFTTALAQFESAWYRAVFLDANGNESATEWVFDGEGVVDLIPSPATARARSQLLRQMFPDVPYVQQVEDDLRGYIEDAAAVVRALTGRALDENDPAEPNLRRLAERAVVLMAEYISATSRPALALRTVEGKRLRSISAGPWSESYFAPGEFARRGVPGRPAMDPDPRLDVVLWALATEDAREQFLAEQSGIFAPAGVAVEFDYRRMGRGGVGLGFGPDGW